MKNSIRNFIAIFICKKKFFVPVLLLSLTSGLILSCQDNSNPLASPNNDKLTSIFEHLTDSLIANSKVPGLIAAVWAPDQNLTWIKAKGKSNIATGEAMKDDMKFRMGSVTKTFTYTVLLQLVDEGKVSLEDKITKYLPNYSIWNNITIRMICNHSSGIYNYTDKSPTLAGPVKANPMKIWQPQELVDIAYQEPFYFTPGSGYHYSNTNTIIAGMIIEKITGNTLPYELKKRILEPLKLYNTAYPADNFMWGNYSHGYSWGENESPLPDVTEAFNPSYAGFAGALISDIYDLKTWVQVLVKGSLISSSLQTERLNAINDSPLTGYGLGIANLGIENGKKIWGHSGTIFGFKTLAYYWPEKNITFILLFNNSSYDPTMVLVEFFDKTMKFIEGKL
ncbi:MAG: serine hydrolase [Ignavibacteriales bacterium]|nr:serine hydrolase [Ignavibacteriales bacterium]